MHFCGTPPALVNGQNNTGGEGKENTNKKNEKARKQGRERRYETETTMSLLDVAESSKL